MSAAVKAAAPQSIVSDRCSIRRYQPEAAPGIIIWEQMDGGHRVSIEPGARRLRNTEALKSSQRVRISDLFKRKKK